MSETSILLWLSQGTGGIFCRYVKDHGFGMFSAQCLDLRLSAQGWGLVVSTRHHAVFLNFTQPLKFLFFGRKLKYCEVLAC